MKMTVMGHRSIIDFSIYISFIITTMNDELN